MAGGQDVGFFDVGEACPDIVIENGDLKADPGLEMAALISMFSDKRVTFEELPRGQNSRRGWWADLISEPIDDEIGSKLWRLEAIGKVTNATAVELENVLADAFAWMLDDGIAARIVVNAERTDTNQVDGSVKIFKPDGDNIPFKFAWDGQRLKLFEESTN